MHRLEEYSDQFLTQMNLDVEWQRFQNRIVEMIIERLKVQDDRLDKKLESFALESSVEDRLKMKSSKYDYGTLFKEIADFRLGLNPLIERKHILEKFIEQVLKQEIKEGNAKDFYQKLEQMSSRIKDLASAQDKELEA